MFHGIRKKDFSHHKRPCISHWSILCLPF